MSKYNKSVMTIVWGVAFIALVWTLLCLGYAVMKHNESKKALSSHFVRVAPMGQRIEIRQGESKGVDEVEVVAPVRVSTQAPVTATITLMESEGKRYAVSYNGGLFCVTELNGKLMMLERVEYCCTFEEKVTLTGKGIQVVIHLNGKNFTRVEVLGQDTLVFTKSKNIITHEL